MFKIQFLRLKFWLRLMRQVSNNNQTVFGLRTLVRSEYVQLQGDSVGWTRDISYNDKSRRLVWQAQMKERTVSVRLEIDRNNYTVP